jgi:IS5 family transposase
MSGQKRRVTRALRAMIKQRSAIEPTIEHTKADGKFRLNWLKGAVGDAMHAVLCGASRLVRDFVRCGAEYVGDTRHCQHLQAEE